jgi:alkylated DNA repair dioxygenase AlkB
MSSMHPIQQALFGLPDELPHGLIYEPDFLSRTEEASLLAEFERLPFNEARFQQYTARRRVVRFGEGDYPASYGSTAEANPRRPFPEFLQPLRNRIAAWRGLDAANFVHALVTEYRPGTPIGWHSDAPHFEIVVGVSLAGAARMQFRPYAPRPGRKQAIELELAPRSVYVMRDDIRWCWQHHIPPTRDLRYSITLRTLHEGPPPRRRARADPGDLQTAGSGG